MTEHDCTPEEFKAWCNQLTDLLKTYELPADDDAVDSPELHIALYGQQVKRLLDELTLLAQYKASTEAAKRRSQDPEFLAEMRARIEELDGNTPT